jgi:hypothetical protein
MSIKAVYDLKREVILMHRDEQSQFHIHEAEEL